MRSFVLILFLSFVSTFSSQVILDWEVYHPVNKSWQPFGKSGTVQQWLWHRGELPDPFYGENEAQYQWIEDHEWHFRSKFFLNEAFFNATTLLLDIPNLDTYAQIFVNGKPLAKTDNFFVHHQFLLEVKDLVCGYNSLELKIEAPISYHSKSDRYKSFTYPAPNDAGAVKVASLTRKPQYQFGWDWAPRINTIGFVYPISINILPEIQVQHIVVNTISINQNGSAEILLNGTIATKQSGVSVKSQIFKNIAIGPNSETNPYSSSSKVQELALAHLTLEQNLNIPNAQLWWPVGQGAQHLYQDTLRFYNEKGQLLLEHPFTFGVRKVELLQEKDEWGTSFAFQLNGRKVFAKGANIIPPGMFAGAELDSAYVALVGQMQAANFNIVRIWGGGMYAPDAFMAACDRAGIMVWHDFMFACAMYPGDEAFLSNITTEVKQQIPRLAAHPSLVYFNGNNEVDVAWHNWGFQVQYRLFEKEQHEIEEAYQKLFRQILPAQVSSFTASSIPYVHTSPLSNWGKEEYFDYGTMHYWGVWHGKDPLADFANKIGRFNAEYGFQSFPEPSTINRFAPSSEQSLHSVIMKNHQKSYVGNGMIEKHAKHYYGKAKDFEQFIYFSQLTQRKAVSMAISGHRADAPRCMGTIFWQLNDCWPAPTWSSLDDQNNWKALHYAVREDYRSIAVLEQFKDDRTYLVLTSELPDDTLVTVQMEFYNSNGQLEDTQRRTYPIQCNTVQVLSAISPEKQGFVKVILDEHYARLFTFIEKRKAPSPKINFQIESADPNTKTGILLIENTEPLVDLWLYAEQQNLHFEQNFQTYLPGKHRLLFTYKEQLPNIGEISYQLR
ncbi:MAG: glycosyl hydrolase 2 galactose-binding domain-containing protein [Flavobacteriales bacterium]